MNVQELIAALSEVPGSHQVILASDAEGNNYSYLAEAMDGKAHVRDKSDVDFYEATEDAPEDGIGVVCLWPV